MNSPATLPISALRPNRFQPRKHFSAEDIHDLVESVREKGILQPILVRPLSGDSYEIVAGERRWRAAQQAQLHDVPVVVREMSDGEALELAIVENVQRADLNAIEEAAAYHELVDRFGYTQDRIAREIGKSRSHVSNTMRLLRLPDDVKAMVRDGRLTAGHARTLLSVQDPRTAAQKIVDVGMNVREAEISARGHGAPPANGAAVFVLRDGRPLKNIRWHEIERLIAQDDAEIRVLRAVKRRFASVPSDFLQVSDLMTDSRLAELVERANKNDKAAA